MTTKIINTRRAQNVALFFNGSILLLLVSLMTIYFGNFTTLNTLAWVLLAVAAMLVALFRFGGYHFMEIDLTSHEADLKYYRIFPFGRTYRRIKIKGNQLRTIHLHQGWLGFGANLRLEVHTPKGNARYPFIGLGAVSRTDRLRIAEALRKMQ